MCRSHIGRLVQQSLLRGIAVLFLFYTGVDIAFTDYHRDESLDLTTAVSFADSQDDGLAIIASSSAPADPFNGREVPRDEDCFCCCAHILPSPVFSDSSNAALAQLRGLPKRTTLPTAPIHSLYHPPRSA